ncbi:MAG: hypothetical protein ACE5HV_00120 [Acidobacteriota bacterium]
MAKATEPTGATPETETKKRSTVCTKVYITPDGESRTARPDAIALEFRFHDGPDGAIKTVRRYTLGSDPKDMELCQDWFGRSEKRGNWYAGSKGNAALAVEMYDNGAELLAAGEWSERKEGVGPTPTMVVEAIARALERAGEAVDDERRAAIKAKITSDDKEEQKKLRANALANPAVNAEYEAIKAEKAQERADAAAEKAEGEGAALTGF